MIRRLRDRHRRMLPVIALLTGLALAIAFFSRPPRERAIPDALRTHMEDR